MSRAPAQFRAAIDDAIRHPESALAEIAPVDWRRSAAPARKGSAAHRLSFSMPPMQDLVDAADLPSNWAEAAHTFGETGLAGGATTQGPGGGGGASSGRA